MVIVEFSKTGLIGNGQIGAGLIDLIRKILQLNQILSIIRRILTQTNPLKRNRHGHEPYPIPTRL
ncbi:MAG: hypothetical protein WC856_23520, partial [Methylococcaceae bacterium]